MPSVKSARLPVPVRPFKPRSRGSWAALSGLNTSNRTLSPSSTSIAGGSKIEQYHGAQSRYLRPTPLPPIRGIPRPVLRNASSSTAAAGYGADAPAPVPAPTDLLELYRGLVAQGKLSWDDEQVRCIMQLRRLLSSLEDYQPPLDLLARLTPSAPYLARQARNSQDRGSALNVGSWWKGKGRDEGLGADEKMLVRSLSGEEELETLTTPKGILLTGPPGTGKSLLLSLFYRLLPIPKRRVHYHAFTLSLYRQVFEEMQKRRLAIPDDSYGAHKVENMELAGKKGWRAVFASGRWDEEGKEVKWVREEGIPFIIARNMILEYHVLYFDELQLLDASSAALLRDVLSWYWRLGGVIVACSNRVPEDLYHHGVQKDRMIGFLDALKARCEVVRVDGGRDWRTNGGEGEVRWYGGKDEFDRAWQAATEGQQVQPFPISVYGRTVVIPRAVGRTCRLSFSDLCEQPLGPADYLTLASTFSTFFIDDLPTLLLKHKNEARRLINLVDALYESRCQLHIQSSATPTTLFFPDALTLNDAASSSSSGTAKPALNSDEMTNERIMAAEALSETLAEPYRPNVSLYNTQTPSQKARRSAEDARGKESGSAFSVLGIWTGEDERFAYKRAVSRLIEMTSSPTYAKEEWLPLERGVRTWETAAPSPSTSSSSSPSSSLSSGLARGGWASLPAPTLRVENNEGSDDLAIEAGYSRPHRLTTSALDRDPTPQLTPDPELAGTTPHRGKGKGKARLTGETDAKVTDADAEKVKAKAKAKVLYNPPVFGEKHVWGVEDGWGTKAGRWGMGVKAFTFGRRSDSESELESSAGADETERVERGRTQQQQQEQQEQDKTPIEYPTEKR